MFGLGIKDAVLAITLIGGIASGIGWWNSYVARAVEAEQNKQAVMAYATAFEDAREASRQKDMLLVKQEKQRRKVHAKAATAVEGVRKVARQEVQKKIGGKCGPWSNTLVPRYFVDVLRLSTVAAATGDKTSIRDQSATERALSRLRAAKAREQARLVHTDQ